MKIGIISDIHDHIDNLGAVLQQLGDADVLLCCGDFCSPFVMKMLGERFSNPIHAVFGNNDGDLYRLTTIAGNCEQITLHGELAELEYDGRRIVMTHFDNIARAIAGNDRYDLICFGHNHQQEISKSGNSLLVNPGEVMGGLSGNGSSFAVYDTTTGEARLVNLT